MNTTAADLTLSTESLISIIGILIPALLTIIGGIYAIVTSTKKYELTENYRKELLQWYSSVSELMIRIIHCSESGEFFTPEFHSQRTNMLAKLSSLIEVGRFYFPNVIKGDGFGTQKTSAYQGYRHINLEFLCNFYGIASQATNNKDTGLLWELERYFTSAVFDMIEPRKRNRSYSKYLALTLPKEKSIEDFLKDHTSHTYSQ